MTMGERRLPRIDEVIVVEGVYDKNALMQVVDATVIAVDGFRVFHDRKLRGLLRSMADARGVVVLTDSDAAGFVIRNHLKSVLPPGRVKHAYIPDVPGKERRKEKGSREGKLGVEGMPPEILLKALRDAGATLDGDRPVEAPPTAADYFEWGLSGRESSAQLRDELKKHLGMPERLSAKGLFSALSVLYTRSEIKEMLKKIKKS